MRCFSLGFLALVKGADLLVDGASSIARRFNVSDFAIGLTVVAFGTSTPELFVTLVAVFEGSPDIAVGNVIGSNIANTSCPWCDGPDPTAYDIPGMVFREMPFGSSRPARLLFVAGDAVIEGPREVW